MLLNPPYLWALTEGGNNTRSEKRFLVDSLYHLMYGGLLIYIIPYYRLTADICRVLCDNFEDITIWRFMGAEFKRFKQVAIMDIRRKRRDGSDMAKELASRVLEPDMLPELSELPDNRYPLPATAKKVELFKGAEFNVAELAEQLKRSTSFSRLFEKNKLDGDIKQPLLPLNVGQVGLIGGSGLINGLVECDTPHIIKGRIVKENRISKEDNYNNRGDITSTTVYETRSNKMIFNLLTPQGFISLTDYTTGSTDTDANTDTNKARGGSSGSIVINAPAVVSPREKAFSLGRLVATANASHILSPADINKAVARHQSGDWGEVSEADWKANNKAVKNGDRILSAYKTRQGISSG
jgi:hypothetical protein